jgi:Pyruvate/2-oxoacid:ferredoxin oxidoreductase delta subunit
VIDDLLICYFSGTGNALTAARWIAASAQQRGIPTRVYSIEDQDRVALPVPGEKTLLGICFPTHGFSAPWLVLRFIVRLPRRSGAGVFLLNTRAGAMIAGVPVPGLSGIATWLLMLLFALKGMRTRGVLPLDMPHSWTALCPPNTRKSVPKLIGRCRRRVDEFSSRLLAGGRCYSRSIWLTLPIDLALLPGAVAYMLVGRFVVPKTVFASVACNTCRLCEEQCPTRSIRIVSGRPFWSATCENCGRCMNLCPKRSIQSWLGRALLLAYLLVSLGVWLWPVGERAWRWLVTAAVFPLYRLLHLLWGVRWINRAFEYTSLTRYWQRYLAPGLKAKDLHVARAGGGAASVTDPIPSEPAGPS